MNQYDSRNNRRTTTNTKQNSIRDSTRILSFNYTSNFIKNTDKFITQVNFPKLKFYSLIRNQIDLTHTTYQFIIIFIMKISYLCLLLLLILHTSSLHLRWAGGFVGPILMGAFQDFKVKEAVRSLGPPRSRERLRLSIAEKIAEEIKKDPSALDRISNKSFPEGKIGRVELTAEQKGKLLKIVIYNTDLLKRKGKNNFIKLVFNDPVLRNVYVELQERKDAFKEIKRALFPRVRNDPSVAPYIANRTRSSDPEFRKVWKLASARIMKSDPDLQKIVAKARFGFDPTWTKLSEDQRVKLLNLINDNEKSATLRWRSVAYLKLVVDTIKNEPSLKDFYTQNEAEIKNKVLRAEQKKSFRSGNSHELPIFQDIIQAGIHHFRQKTLPSAQLILNKLKQHPKTKDFFIQGTPQPQNPQLIKATTIEIIKSDVQLQKQLASDMFTRGVIGKLMNDEQRIAMLKLALNNPSFFEANAQQEKLKKEMVDLMKKDPLLAKFYAANEKKILANMV